MIRDICKDEAFLSQKAETATPDDIQIASDLLETLEHHKDGCVGMAANMIGIQKRIIVFDNEGTYMVMFNPEIIKKSGPMMRRRAASPSPAGGRPSGTAPSKWSIRTRPSRPGGKPSPAFPPRSSSTRSTTATGF